MVRRAVHDRVLAIVFLAPLAYALYLSLFRDQLVGGNAFVWFANYGQALTDPKFWEAFGRVFVFLIVQVPIMLVLALGAALAIDSGGCAARRSSASSIFLPYAVPAVVAVLMWGYIYGDQFGAHREHQPVRRLRPHHSVREGVDARSIGNIVNWEFVGYNMLIFYSSLKTIPTESYEASSIDGAGAVADGLLHQDPRAARR